jgi:hypothetical protein
VVVGNSPNHLKDFKEGIRIRVLFFKDQCGPCVCTSGRGIEEGGGVGDSLKTFTGWKRFTWSVEERNGKNIYVLCVRFY